MRPEFFTDPTLAKLSIDVRLTYIGLWIVADDAGYLDLDVAHVATMLYPYESVRVRTRRLEKARDQLVEFGRLTLYDCGCALIPKLVEHQKIGGNKSFTARDRHQVHTSTDLYDGRVGNGRVGRLEARARATSEEETEAMLRAYRRQGLPV